MAGVLLSLSFAPTPLRIATISTYITRRENLDSSHLSSISEPLLRRLYANRNVTSAKELDHRLPNLLNPNTLKGMDEAVRLMFEAIQQQQKIMVIGDFDADGATSTALSLLTLTRLGAQRVEFLVPNRFDYGYGLSPPLVDIAHEQGVNLIMTVDNGISSISGVARAKELGITVIITDHHLAGTEIPDADAIVNPNQPGCDFASKNLAGVGVAFYLMLALRALMRKHDWFAQQGLAEPNMAEFLDVVALGTVADVVPLDANNRILVEQGMQRIRAGRCRPGIKAILEVAKRNLSRCVATDLGFAVGPRLNAAGRLDDMALGIQCLLTDDPALAHQMAMELDSLNKARREIEGDMQVQALKIIDQLPLQADDLPYALCLYQSDWHQGVSGIVASRIKEKFHRPVIVFAQSGDGELKGSGRSIEGLHLRDLLERINSSAPALIIKFGGHAMAAGLSIREEGLAEFTRLFDHFAREELTPDQLSGKIISDGELSSGEFTLPLADLLRRAGPWGQAFPEPCFDGKFKLIQQRLVGEKHLKLVLEPEAGGVVIDAIAFNVDLAQWPDPRIEWVEVAYRLDVNEFRGQQSVQLMVEHLNPL